MFWLLSFAQLCSSAILYYNSTLPSNLTPDCTNALSQNVSCSRTIINLQNGVFYSNDTLTRTCTDSCDKGLDSWYTAVLNACSNQTWSGLSDEAAPVPMIPDLVRYQYHQTCLSDSGRFCNLVGAQAAGAWSAIDMGTNNTSTCDLCFIKSLQLQAESPFNAGPDLDDLYASKTSSCGVTGYDLTFSTPQYAG